MGVDQTEKGLRTEPWDSPMLTGQVWEDGMGGGGKGKVVKETEKVSQERWKKTRKMCVLEARWRKRFKEGEVINDANVTNRLQDLATGK